MVIALLRGSALPASWTGWPRVPPVETETRRSVVGAAPPPIVRGRQGRLCGPTLESPAAIHTPKDTTVPFKTNADRRHHIPKQRHRVMNWAEYDEALRQRGSLTGWLCVQRRLACSAGDKPAGVEVRAP